MGLRIKDDYYREILKEFEPLFKDAIELEIQLGNNISIENAKQNGKRTKDSGLVISKKDLDTYTKKLMLNIKDANADLSKQISNSVLENISNRGSNQDLAKELKRIFDKDSSDHFNYKKRFETIARTESTNVLATSSYNKASKLGAKRKYVSAILDGKTSQICKTLNKKYGTPETAIPIDKPFKVNVNGKEVESMAPAFHPNCRSLLLYEF